MPIRVKCEKCKKTLSVKDHLAGKKIKCPVCQNVVVVAASPAPADVAAPKPAAGVPVGKKSSIATKPAKVVKPAGPAPPNGTPPAATSANGNGAVKNGEPEPPPEHVEAEALSALADEPPPVEEDTTPQTIDFKCQWCDEELKLPIDQAGKQTQCPNEECGRIIKVPLPKVEGKKDWRKMDRRGPAAAIVNQPEELENAWGTETSTRARQDSLRQAGAVEEPKKPGLGAFGWIRRGFLICCAIGLATAAIVGLFKLRSSNQQYRAIKNIEEFVNPADLKIKDPLLRADAHRTLGLLYLREPAGANKAMDHLKGVPNLVEQSFKQIEGHKDKAPVNEDLFLIDAALAFVEIGGTDEEFREKKKQPWNSVREGMANALMKIQSPEVQVMALRELGTRLCEREKAELAIQLAGNLASVDASTKSVAYRQHIALLYAKGEAEAKKALPGEPEANKDVDGHLRVGFAEAYARTEDYAKAAALAKAPGFAVDRLDACIGVASIALGDPKNKDKASQFLQDALTIAAERGATPTQWQQLQLVRLAARLDKLDAVKEILDKRLTPPFKLRAQLEIFLAKCESSPSTASADDLADLEKSDKDGTTLGLAWAALARTNGNREQNRKAFDSRAADLSPELVTLLRPMVDVGTYLGMKK